MNILLETYARNEIKNHLRKCTEAQQMIFKRMYAHKNLDVAIDTLVDTMPIDRLDWALALVTNTTLKNSKNSA
jgi:hypothetical protein